MPAYDFEEAFKESKPSPSQEKTQGAFSHDKSTLDVYKGMSSDDKQSLFEGEKPLIRSKLFKNNSWNESLSMMSKKFFSNKEESEAEKQARSERTALAKDLLNFLNPSINNSISFHMTRGKFKVLLLLVAAFVFGVSLWIGGVSIFIGFLISSFLTHLQLNDALQMEIYENEIWKSIKSIPEEKLKESLYAVMSNDLSEEIYTDDEIKETIDAYLYSEDKIIKTEAQFKIRENLRHFFQLNKKLAKEKMLST